MRYTTKTATTNEVLAVIGAAGVGMLAMYLFDPDQGRRRRSLATDKVRSAGTHMSHMADVAWRDGMNRSRGMVATLRSSMGSERVPAHRLEERVRSRIGRVVSNPRALEVRADDQGTIVLSGPVLARELPRLMATAWSVRGVNHLENHLQVHEQAGNEAALQGTSEGAQGRGIDDWPPAVRMLAGSAGIAAAAISASRGRALGLLGALLGGALLARSIENRSLRDMAGLGSGYSVHIEKEMFIAAPPERVFEFWCHQEDFPRYMRNVEDVRAAGHDRWHWKVAGPFRSVEWDAEIIEREENRRLVWRSVPGASVDSEGRVDFEPEGTGTRLHVSMSYTPTAGAVGNLFAKLLGRDAKSEMDEDLMRVKSYLETGTVPPDAASPGQQQAAGAAGAEEAARLH